MVVTVAEIAEKIGGVCEDDSSVEIVGLAGLKDARQGEITFLANPRYTALVAETGASAVIVNEDFEGPCSGALIRVKNADKAFMEVASLFAPAPVEIDAGVHSTAVLSDDVQLGDNVKVGPYCVLEKGVKVGSGTVLYAGCYLGHGVAVGEDCKFYPHVSVRENAKIGSRVIIHNGSVIGSDGFGYVNEGASWKKIPQFGIVEIGDDVEIGANVTVDRARFGRTVISNGVKIDNLVQIAHNVKIGENTAMAAQAGISGSSTIGKNVQIGGQAGAAGHINIGDNSVVGAQAGVTKDVAPQTFVSGYPAMPHKKAGKLHAHMMRLPDLKKKVKELEKRVKDLEG